MTGMRAWRAIVAQRRSVALVAGLVAIIAWQRTFETKAKRLDSTYSLAASSGLHEEWRFAYFYYYLDLFPVMSTLEPPGYSTEVARDFFTKQGSTLIMELGWSWRAGEHGRIFLFLFDAFRKGVARDLSVIPFHRVLFVSSLLALYASLWSVRRLGLGCILVALLGSNPFQLFEVYAHENLFGWPISVAILMLALHVPLIFRKPLHSAWSWTLPLFAGLMLATVRTIRSEPVVMGLSIVVCYATAAATWRQRLALIALFSVALVIGTRSWNYYFDKKFRETRERVAAVGGDAYDGPLLTHHDTWHPIFCGLGDFDRKHGYRWDDVVAYSYATRAAKAKGVALPHWSGGGFTDEYWDSKHRYPKALQEFPEYTALIRDKVVHDIVHDPIWYLGILARRAGRVLWTTTPLQLAIGTHRLRLPIPGVFVLLPLVLLALRREWPPLALTAFLFPLSIPALIIYSGLGMTLYSCYHIAACAVLIDLGFRAARARVGRTPT